MYKKNAHVVNPIGLHARPATMFIRTATEFTSSIRIRRPGGAEVNAKSIIMLLSQGFTKGTEVEISAEGEDEKQAVEALCALLASGCGEELD
ncbi:HPr family phosphocarrier protein [Ruminococcaceae bacterium OttesenSCG-928-I18]|nr:HPr family phosphocarrier protein [Ruminococcaceae bacterium OttesenSCG-928-I18]